MRDLINIILNSFETYPIIYRGQALSLNDFFANSGTGAWRKRKGMVDKYKSSFGWLIKEAKLPWLEEFALIIFYNSRHDCDNVVGGMGKCFLDALKQEEENGCVTKHGYCKDDSRNYCKMVTAVYDKTLENNTFKFQIIKIK